MAFAYGHATHPQWRMAALLVLAQIRARLAKRAEPTPPSLGLLYITDHYATDARAILDFLGAELPTVTDWAGSVGVAIAATNAEYFDEPGLALMLCDLPANQYRVFSGVAPLGLAFDAQSALVHADGGTPDLGELVAELARRTASGYLFGGLASSRGAAVQFAQAGDGNIKGQGLAGGVFTGGISGVAFGPEVRLVSRLTQGCQPLGGTRAVMREITALERNVVTELDGEPALDLLLRDLDVSLDDPHVALAALRRTLVGLTRPTDRDQTGAAIGRAGNFGNDVMVRHIIGLDPSRRGFAVADMPEIGDCLAFCQRDARAARADLIRICAEIREELDAQEPRAALHAGGTVPGALEARPRVMAGAVYVSCTGRGGPHFGEPGAELRIVRQALGDVPLVGFFAGGEIAHDRLYGYSGVLTVFIEEDRA